MSGCDAFAKLVDRAFVGELSRRQRQRLRTHLESCDACRRDWQRLAVVDRQLGGPMLSTRAIEEIRAAVTGAQRVRKRWAWVTGAMAAAAAAIVLLLVSRIDSHRDEFTARGTPSAGRTPGVRLFCVAGDRDHVRAEARMVSRGPIPTLRCTIEDDLQLAYTSPAHEALTMVAFARIDSSTIPYGPALLMRPDRIDELVDWSIRVSTDHHVGTYDVVVRFYDHRVMSDDGIAARSKAVVELRARLEVIPPGGLDVAP